MESQQARPTTEYQRFGTSNEKRQTCKKRPGAVCLALILFAVFIAAVSFTIYNYWPHWSRPESEPLQLTNLTDTELRGKYCNTKGCILFHTLVNSSHVYLLVASTDDSVVLMIIHLRNTPMAMMKKSGTYFLMMKSKDGPQKYTLYMIPKNSEDTLNSIMMGQKVTLH